MEQTSFDKITIKSIPWTKPAFTLHFLCRGLQRINRKRCKKIFHFDQVSTKPKMCTWMHPLFFFTKIIFRLNQNINKSINSFQVDKTINRIICFYPSGAMLKIFFCEITRCYKKTKTKFSLASKISIVWKQKKLIKDF